MKSEKHIILLWFLFLLLFSSCASPRFFEGAPDQPYVILKLDDLWNEEGLVHPGWQQVVDFLNEEGVKGTIGLVCNSLEEGDETYFQWIKDRAAEGYEIWHHGYCHCKPMVDGEEKREFRGTDYAYQLEHLSKAQNLADDKLDLTLRSFGAPYNATDEFTAQALAQLPDLKVWMYKETPFPTDKFVLPRISEVNIEYPVHQPDFDKFKAGYEQFQGEPILVIQGHPRSWVDDPSRFEAFKQIVLFLKSERVRFTTPYAYYQNFNAGS
jgi:peptidoglycan/xylan/chitin deacetylase (PgdA/CDA1 family)